MRREGAGGTYISKDDFNLDLTLGSTLEFLELVDDVSCLVEATVLGKDREHVLRGIGVATHLQKISDLRNKEKISDLRNNELT